MLDRIVRELRLDRMVAIALPCLALVPIGCVDDSIVVRTGEPLPNEAEGESSSASGSTGSGNAPGGTPRRGAASGMAAGSGEGSTPGAGGAAALPLGPPVSSGPLGASLPDDEAQAWVFDEAEIHTYALALDPAVWAALQLNARDEEYVEAEFSAGGLPLGRVGLRFKGSFGTLASCFEDDGTPRCSKMSMKLKFDEYLPEQRFAGLKRLNFNSMLFDDSLMHERLAYRVFREMGIVAPRAVHARLLINGEDLGVFALVEDVDGRFTKSQFAAGDGNLYKEAWPSNADADILADALETNEDIADHSAFSRFQADLLAAAPEELPSVLERHVDVDQMLAHLAVDQTLVNWDGITAFYCFEGFCENHNYYVYRDEAAARFSFIPWDLDNTFEPSPIASVPSAFDATADCSTFYEAMGRILRAPGCDPLLQGLVLSGGARYVAQLDRLLQGPLAPGTLEGWIDDLEAQLAPEVETDFRGPDVETFRTEVNRLRRALDGLRESAQAARGTRL
jgi:spore coat protein H